MIEWTVVNENTMFTKYMLQSTVSENRYVLFINYV